MRLKVRLLHKNRGQPDNFSYVIVEAENGNDAAVIALESINHPDNPLGIRYERTLVSHIEPAPNPEAKPINKVKPTLDGLVEEQAEVIEALNLELAKKDETIAFQKEQIKLLMGKAKNLRNKNKKLRGTVDVT